MYKTKAALVLASGSPRRKELLSRMGLTFEVAASNIVEEESGSPPEAFARYWAEKKCRAVAAERGGVGESWHLGVDTIVVIDGAIMGKPSSPQEAASFLRKLSGNCHEVISGYCILGPGERVASAAISSKVKIKRLDDDEIEAYVRTGEPLDKAGAYAVQGIGAFMVERINGSYTNVVGLPLTEVVGDLKRLGVIEVG